MAPSAPKYYIPEKKYFGIGDASRVTQVPEYTLRYWEKEFQIVRPMRRETGHRRYTKKDLETIFRIKELIYRKKFTLSGAKRELSLLARKSEDHSENAQKERARRIGGRPVANADLVRRLKKEVKETLLELEKEGRGVA